MYTGAKFILEFIFAQKSENLVQQYPPSPHKRTKTITYGTKSNAPAQPHDLIWPGWQNIFATHCNSSQALIQSHYHFYTK